MIAHYFRIACQQLEKYKLQTLLSLVGLAIGFTCFVLFIHFIHPKGMDDTYWRDEVTGDWFIGFTPESVIYADKFWDIVSQTEEEDSYQLVVSDVTVNLPI